MEKSNSRNNYLIKNTILFSIGNFGSKIINFLLVPLYTNILTTSEYGTLDLITVLSMVLVPIITLNISESIMRFSLDKNSDKNKILSIVLLMTLISFVISLLMIFAFNFFSITREYSLVFSLYVFSLSFSTILLCYIRGIEKLVDYSLISIFQSLCIALLNILFLTYYKMGIKGYILAFSISYIITSILCILRGKVYKIIFNIKLDKMLLKKMIKYSILLIPNSLMWWIINSLDRIMITNMISLKANGIYAVSYKIPTILITMTTIFNQAWMFSAVKEKDSLDKNEYTSNVFNSLTICVTTISAFLIIILKPLLSFYVGIEFFDSWNYVPPLLVGTIFLTLGTFLSNEYTANKDSIGFLKSSTVGAITNLFLNLFLIKSIGVIGAAIATCISYLSVFIFRYFDTKKYVKIKIFDKNIIFNLIIVILLSLLIYSSDIIINIFMVILFILMVINNKVFWISIIKNTINKCKKRSEVKYE